MSLNRLITILAIVLLVSVGCGKKKKADKAVETTNADIETVKDTADIFDEFYDDDNNNADNTDNAIEDNYSSNEVPEFNPNGRYVVQVSCVLSKALAEDVVKKLESKGYPAYISEVENPTTNLLGVYHRIRIGGFSGISDAKSFGENQLSMDGYEYWVDNKSNDNVGIGGYGLGETQESSTYDNYETTTTDSYDSYESTETTPEPVVDNTPETPTTVDTVAKETTTATDDFGSTTTEATSTEAIPATTTEPATAGTSTEAVPATTTEPAPEVDEWETSDDDWGSDTTGW